MGFCKSGIWGKELFQLSFIFLWVHAWDSPFRISGSILDWRLFAWWISLLTRRGHQLDFADGQSHWLRFLLWCHFKQECGPPRSDGCKSCPSSPSLSDPRSWALQIPPVVPERWDLSAPPGNSPAVLGGLRGSEGVHLGLSFSPAETVSPRGPSQIGTVSAWGSGDVVRV